jgi:hypothetical protein
MPQDILNYRSPHSEVKAYRARPVRIAAGIAAGVTVAVNLALVLVAEADRSWGAAWIAILIGPVTNVVLVIASLAGIPFVRRAARGGPIDLYVLAGILCPVVGAIVDWVCITSMDMHGC